MAKRAKAASMVCPDGFRLYAFDLNGDQQVELLTMRRDLADQYGGLLAVRFPRVDLWVDSGPGLQKSRPVWTWVRGIGSEIAATVHPALPGSPRPDVPGRPMQQLRGTLMRRAKPARKSAKE